MQRLSAPERTREELRALMNGDLGTAAGRGDLVRLALRLIVEETLEGEVSDALGRERYERGEGEKPGYRNGYRTGKVKTAEGAVEYAAPQVRDTPEPFISSVRAALAGRTRELERLAVELYARGLSTRDIEDAFTDETGRRLLSRAAVSEITERLWAEYEDFCKRDLSEHAVVYLFVDGIAERLRPGQRREAVLAAWGVGEDGRKVLLGLMAGSKEDVETVRGAQTASGSPSGLCPSDRRRRRSLIAARLHWHFHVTMPVEAQKLGELNTPLYLLDAWLISAPSS
jgi:putative transposase